MLTHQEVERLLAALDGVPWIMAMLLYGSGLRLMECLRLRVKDIDFTKNEILVREGKGNKDRVTTLAAAVNEPLVMHLDRVRGIHERDLKAGFGRVQLPDAMARNYPNADREWGCQWVFPAARICTDPRFGPPQRYHLHESVLHRAIDDAAPTTGPFPPVACHHPLTLSSEARRRVIYSHVLNRGGRGVQRPADHLVGPASARR